MRFLIINTDYDEFIGWLYAQTPGLEGKSYAEQYRARMETMFGTADFYSYGLRQLGHEAWDVIANIEPSQKQWAQEHGLRWEKGPWRFRMRRGVLPWLYREHLMTWFYPILAAQVRAYRPDVIFCYAMETIGSEFLRSVRRYYRIAVGQHSATPLDIDISDYDLVVSSLPNQVDFFRRQGLKSELLRLAFDPRVLQRLTNDAKKYGISFVGGLGGFHEEGTATLERMAARLPVSVWGYGVERLGSHSCLRANHKGPLWGMEMYQAMHDSRIVFNRHSNLADRFYANNLRLYESTGVGSFLLTDLKQNLGDMFEVGREIVAYRNADECIDLATHYLENHEEREAIATRGKARTLRDHTYEQRMREFTEVVRKVL